MKAVTPATFINVRLRDRRELPLMNDSYEQIGRMSLFDGQPRRGVQPMLNDVY